MNLLGLFIGGVVGALLLRMLVRYLGVPSGAQAVGRWIFALLVVAVLMRSLPEILPNIPASLPTAATDNDLNAVGGIFVLLTVIGWIAWKVRPDRPTRSRQTEHLIVRRRALPPPPQALGVNDGPGDVAGGD